MNILSNRYTSYSISETVSCGNFWSNGHRHAIGIGNVIMSNSTPYRNHWAEHTAETYTNIFYHDAIVCKTGNFQQTVLLWWCGRVYQDAVDIFGNCCFIDAFWQLLDLSWMQIKHIKGLQVTEIRSIKYSQFHNYFGAVHSGPDRHIWRLWLHWYMLAAVGFILDAHKAYKGTASGSKQIHQLFQVS